MAVLHRFYCNGWFRFLFRTCKVWYPSPFRVTDVKPKGILYLHFNISKTETQLCCLPRILYARLTFFYSVTLRFPLKDYIRQIYANIIKTFELLCCMSLVYFTSCLFFQLRENRNIKIYTCITYLLISFKSN